MSASVDGPEGMPAMGQFRAVTTRDGIALERDGQGFYELNELKTSGEEPLAEIRFGDGLWMLVNPETDVLLGGRVG